MAHPSYFSRLHDATRKHPVATAVLSLFGGGSIGAGTGVGIFAGIVAVGALAATPAGWGIAATIGFIALATAFYFSVLLPFVRWLDNRNKKQALQQPGQQEQQQQEQQQQQISPASPLSVEPQSTFAASDADVDVIEPAPQQQDVPASVNEAEETAEETDELFYYLYDDADNVADNVYDILGGPLAGAAQEQVTMPVVVVAAQPHIDESRQAPSQAVIHLPAVAVQQPQAEIATTTAAAETPVLASVPAAATAAPTGGVRGLAASVWSAMPSLRLSGMTLFSAPAPQPSLVALGLVDGMHMSHEYYTNNAPATPSS